MSEPRNPRRPARGTYRPRPETLALLRVSGNPINGLGETAPRRPSPFFWHPPDQHPWGDLQVLARTNSRKCPGSTEAFQAAYSHPELIPVAATRNPAPAAQLAAEATAFALDHEADAVGIAAMDPLYVFEGYTLDEPWVIVLALAHNYERLREVPSDETNGVGVCDVGDQYARGTRCSYALANWIRSQGYSARAFPGPSADALALIPPAIASGLGELGKHGSLISRHFGSGVRLAGVTTDMPLVATTPDRFGADEFCATCQICTNACPPSAISPEKQMVRGVERWYVDFDKCIPFFAEAASCGICIAECPWTRPAVRPRLLATMASRLEEQ
ncbi:MAG TPA: 4Fe-4S dicluster domain-containing protein [Acidobacteriaceae bacterium]|jgi:ferredoxin|nr:4Fe-4S dicluster domain-containing protein [Acidobacteriaceae bacterium]